LAALLRDEQRSETWSPLMPLQPGGSQLPLFWIHGDWSNALLPEYLGPDRPLYALEHQALDGRPALYTRVETIAAYYLKELKSICPHGPYLLGGYSFGAAVAFEVAQLLAREREEVAMLFLLDPPGGAATSSAEASDESPQPFASARREARKSVRSRVKISLFNRLVAPRAWIGKTLQRARWKACLRNHRLLPPQLRSPYILDVYRKALRSYAPTTYAGPVTIVKDASRRYRPSLSWPDLIGGPVEIHEVTGGHMNLTKEPHVAQWATKLRDSLDRVTIPLQSRRRRYS